VTTSNPPTDEKLYALLPALYKLRDAAAGDPMRVLLSIIESQLDRVEGDITALYDNWFIETCDEWVVPYIGDLLGVRGQYAYDEKTTSLRPYIANTLGYRGRKGTVSVLEQLAQDTTGWPGRVVEFFQLLATTQHINHIRSIDLRTPDLRDTNALELLDGPFESAMHFAEVRRIPAGKYNIPNVGIFLWRLLAISIDRAPAIPMTAIGPGRYVFSQVGRDAPLFNPSRTDLETGRVGEPDVPGPLRPRALFDETEAARAALATGADPSWVYLASTRPSLRVYDDGGEIAPELIQFCDLSQWTMLPPAKSFDVPDPPNPPLHQTTRVAVDPRLGRVAIVSGAVPKALLVNYSFGFPAPLGGGSYARPDPAPDPDLVPITVTAADRTQLVDAALATAIGNWVAAGQPHAIITIGDNAIYDVPDIALPAAGKLIIRALDGFRPVLRPRATWNLTLGQNAALQLDGFVISGAAIAVATQDPAGSAADHSLTIANCTLVPGLTLDETGAPMSPATASLAVAAGSAGPLSLAIDHSITGRVDLRATPTTLTVTNSIVDGCGTADPVIWGAGEVTIECTTVFGGTIARSLEASNVIFDAPAIVERTQIGCVRFSFIANGSQLPRRYMCQPDLALAQVPDADAPLVLARMKPAYTSRRYGDPGYAQLAALCPSEIQTGADDGAEMGAYQLLQQPQRLSNLSAAIAEYLRFGLEAGTFLVT
jgi:hypothetical protein